MLRNVLKSCDKRVFNIFRLYCTNNENKLTEASSNNNNIIDTRAILHDDSVDYREKTSPASPSVLEKCEEDISHVAPYLRPSFNFAAYANKSETIKQLVNLGVELYKFEKSPELPPYILRLDFERDIRPHVLFLCDIGLATEDLGGFITKNPLIFKEDLENLQVRVNYLKSKKFTGEMIARIVKVNPQWLSLNTQKIDKLLGYFQKNYELTGNQVRALATKSPKLITYPEEHIRVNTFVLREEMGFSSDEIRNIILDTPKLLMKQQTNMLKTFEYIHKEMKIPLETIAKMPKVLSCREFRIRQRHKFLQLLGRVQFDPKLPNYISPLTLVEGDDGQFATETAGSSIQAYNAFLKSM